MKLNPTLLELLILIFACLQVYLHIKYAKRIMRWWRERRKRRRSARQLRPRDPSACPQCVERANLTLREHIAPLSRRTWSLAFDRYHLWLHIQWGLAYYHLVRPHRSLRVHVRGPSRQRNRTPAMAAGLTSKRWTVAELLHLPVPEYGEVTPFPVV